MKADWLVCFRSRVAGLHVLGYKNRFIGRCHVHRSHDPTMLMTSLNRSAPRDAYLTTNRIFFYFLSFKIKRKKGRVFTLPLTLNYQ
jgi:hypothetical protein